MRGRVQFGPMTMVERLSRWKDDGVITTAQHEALGVIVRKDRFSVSLELNALLYLGVLSIAAGVLWLALSTLAAWFGIKLTRLGYGSADSLRVSALVYGAIVAGMGASLRRFGIKKHFVETHLHVAATAAFVALTSGVPWADTSLL